MWNRIVSKCAAYGKRLRELLGGRWLLLLAGIAGISLVLLGSCEGTKATESSAFDGSSPSILDYADQMEAEAEALCRRVRGVGDVKVSITLEEGERYTYSGSHLTSSVFPSVRGVAVVCEGGGRDGVRQEITELLCALYHIGANRVHVSPMK